MPREITDEEYNWLQGRRQVADLADSVWNDPQLGNAARALLKKKMPNLQIPDYDIRNEMHQEFAAQEQRRQEEKAAEQRTREDEFWQNQRSAAQKKYNLTDDGMKDLEKKMLENNVGNYDVAASHWAPKEPVASTPTHKDPYWNHGKSDLFKEIAKDPEEWARNEIMGALVNDQNKQRGGF